MSIFNISKRSLAILLAIFWAGSLFAEHSFLLENSNQMNKDTYVADTTVLLSSEALGDAVVAGWSISVVNSVAEDVLAVGGTLNITGNVGDDIRLAGGSIAIVGDVGDDVVAAGGTIVLDSASTVGGHAWLVGGTVTIAANITHGLKAAGEKIILEGTIGGDVELKARFIEIKPGAIIKGSLNYSAPEEAKIHEDASIEGEVNYEEVTFESFEADGPGFVGNLLFYLSLAASAIALFLLFPVRSVSMVKQLQNSPFKSAGLGLLVLFATPFIALMSLISVVGVPIGLIVLALYFAVLIIGLLIGFIWVGEVSFRQIGKEPDESKSMRAWSIATAAIILLVVSWIPFISSWVFFIVLLLGIGEITQYFYQLYSNRDKSASNVAISNDNL